ncbi:MAG: polyprenyl synthetase family protein [Acidobacteriota bacterium]
MSLQAHLTAQREAIDLLLGRLLPEAENRPAELHQAMRYTLLAPGKRVRPLLTLMCGEMLGAQREPLLRAACAIEMVHASSLIMDDLPCMDDASLRRGKETCHQVFGESTALLAALGLLNRAFGVLAELRRQGIPAVRAAEAVAVLSRAIGSEGIIAGQAADLQAGKGPCNIQTLEYIHSHKTGKLFIASAEMGALLAGSGRRERKALVRFAMNLGLAFQIADDLLDASADRETLGKDVRQDKGRTTFATVCGVEGAAELAGELIDHAVEALGNLGDKAHFLRDLAERIRERAA